MQQRTLTNGNCEVLPIAGIAGAEIRGVFLSGEMKMDELDLIRQALLAHRVIFFRNQFHLNDAEHQAFAAQFGEIVAHPTVGSDDRSTILELHSHRGGRANSWHTDVTFERRIPKISILRAVTLPSFGGDTVWANTVAAYQHLPKSFRELADNLWAVHGNDFDYAASRVELLHDESSKEYRAKYAARIIKTEHPVVHIHPESGEKSLLLGHYAQRFVNYNTNDSDHLYQILQSHITRLENTIRWRWSKGDVAMWDNRATQHYAINDYGKSLRLMRRVTLNGDVPISVSGEESRPHVQ